MIINYQNYRCGLKINEIVNGEITLRGDANDDRYISNVVVLHNGKSKFVREQSLGDDLQSASHRCK